MYLYIAKIQKVAVANEVLDLAKHASVQTVPTVTKGPNLEDRGS